MDKVTQADEVLAEEIASASNIVSHDGYYEIDIAAVALALARHRHRLAALAEPRSNWRGMDSAPLDVELWLTDGQRQWQGHGFQWDKMPRPLFTPAGTKPTHWMPLPSPPAPEASDNRENTRG